MTVGIRVVMSLLLVWVVRETSNSNSDGSIKV